MDWREWRKPRPGETIQDYIDRVICGGHVCSTPPFLRTGISPRFFEASYVFNPYTSVALRGIIHRPVAS